MKKNKVRAPIPPPPHSGGLRVSGAQTGGGLAVKDRTVAVAPLAPVNHPAAAVVQSHRQVELHIDLLVDDSAVLVLVCGRILPHDLKE